MGQNITTFNIDELISSYIDNQITDPELKAQIEEKLATDQKLYAKYKAELLTKNLIHSRIHEAELPAATYSKVMASIDSLITSAKASSAAIASEKANPEVIGVPEYPSFWQSLKETLSAPFMGLPRYAYATAAIVLVIGAVFLFSPKKELNPYITSGTDKSIMVQAVKSFNKILKGELAPQLTSGNEADVEKFVMERSNFDPYVPNVDEYQLAGVYCNEYNGQKLAHLIYRKGDELFYIYQAPITCVTKKALDLPEDVHTEIVKAQYFMCDKVDNDNECTMTVWIKDNVLCASMTQMPKQKMQATFTSFYKK